MAGQLCLGKALGNLKIDNIWLPGAQIPDVEATDQELYRVFLSRSGLEDSGTGFTESGNPADWFI
jgi:hypothetical protein